MTDITAFIRARLDEDQATAEAASHGGRWRYEDGESVGAWTLYDEHWNIATLTTYDTESYDYADQMPAFRSPSYVDPDANGRHVARHDPARVLAQVAAMRAIVDLHSGDDEHMCVEDLGSYENLVQAGSLIRNGMRVEHCRTLRLIAAIWRDHDDHDPAWAPEGG